MISRVAKMDVGLFVATLLLLGLGIVLVYSSSFAVAYGKNLGENYFLFRQITRALIAVLLFTVFINVDYRFLSKYGGFIYICALVLLAGVLFLPESQAVNGAKRWITLFGVRFQVSDFARMALIIFLAKKCGDDGAEFDGWRSLIPHYVRIGVICALVVLEPDFSTCVIIAGIALAMLFVAGVRPRYLLATGLAILPIVVILIKSAPYRMKRLAGFINMQEQGQGAGYQVTQSIVGLGRGGFFGAGLGKGEQKYFYLPEPHTDFILSVLGEEFGFIGVMLVLLIFAFIVYRGFSISLNAPDRTGQVMAFGFTMAIALYMLIHASVVTGLLPPTGVPMPFLSYGGMSLIFTMSSVGILLNISSHIKTDSVSMAAPARPKRKALRT
ncbi:MAG: putative lipid II flippase FtsW [Chitinispirillales bacterium]|jgi:cell division protein FtsW|nr:putative lipid II flippase FtsW [Chitinispirillales bacterium]